MDTVPFKLSNVYGGLGEGGGLLHNEGTHLCLEYQVKDGLVGAFKSDVKQVRVAIPELVSVTLNKGWFGMKWFGIKLAIQANRVDAFQDVPGATQGRVELCIAARDYETAEDFVYRLHQNDEAPVQTARA